MTYQISNSILGLIVEALNAETDPAARRSLCIDWLEDPPAVVGIVYTEREE